MCSAVDSLVHQLVNKLNFGNIKIHGMNAKKNDHFVQKDEVTVPFSNLGRDTVFSKLSFFFFCFS